jgi:hypothetical protein
MIAMKKFMSLALFLAILIAIIDLSYLYPVDSSSDYSEDENIQQYFDEAQLDALLAKYLSEKYNSNKHRDESVLALQQPSVDAHLARDRRRISVYKNIYNHCRVQKRKEKNYCLYLANLYHNVKGFHGI